MRSARYFRVSYCQCTIAVVLSCPMYVHTMSKSRLYRYKLIDKSWDDDPCEKITFMCTISGEVQDTAATDTHLHNRQITCGHV